MAINTLGSIDVPLSLFGGLNTELQPPDIPEGVSPDNQDVVYLPGSVDSRPALHKIFATAFPQMPTMVYGKTFVQPNENPLNIYLDSNGIFWTEDVVNTPGTYTQLGSTTPGNWAQSVTAFGREYIATSDLQHGQDIPRQFDGTFLDRVTMDGPATAPQVADQNVGFSILASPSGIVPATAATPILTISEAANLVTLTAAPNFAGFPLEIGDFITLIGFTGAATNYNGLYQISFVSGDQTTIQYVNPTTGLPPVSGVGTVQIVGVAFVLSTPPVGLTVGNPFIVTGATNVAYNGTYTARAVGGVVVSTTIAASLGTSGGGTLSIGGTITPGVHQCVQMFLTRQGYLTKPSPAFSWLASGNKRAMVSGLLIGPSNVVARVLAFTGAGGDNFFTITSPIQLPNPTGGNPIVIQALVVPDNISTSATFDFSDNALFGGQGIDIPGNNLFAQRVLSPLVGFFSYAGRLGTYGEWNKVETFVNMTFDGGSVSTTIGGIPPGWALVGSTGGIGTLIQNSIPALGFSYAMSSAGGTNDCMIQQSAYEDSNGAEILSPNTQYSIRALAQRSPHAFPVNGFLVFELFSPSLGSIAQASFAVAGIATAQMQWLYGQFSGPTPATIPSDVVFRFSLDAANSGISVTVDEVELIYTQDPYRDTLAALSYVNNPEAFDGVTGNLGSLSDPSQQQTFVDLRDSLYFHTKRGLHQTADNGAGEPSTWAVRQVSSTVGAISPRATTSGEDWFITASPGGPYVFSGGDLYKAGQEIQSLWSTINPVFQQTVWAKNDIINRRVYFGIPTASYTAPSLVLPLDYRELNTAYDVASNGPVHISYSGKMISSDLTRKWTRWNIFANFGQILNRGGSVNQMCFGAGNGQAPGTASGFGNVYYLDSSKYTDDDYGEINPYYVTYAFINHEAEVALGTGCHRKLYGYLSMFISGIGQVTIVPLVDSLANAQNATATYVMNQNPNFDLEWGLNVLGERCFFKILPSPLTAVGTVYRITTSNLTPSGPQWKATVNFASSAVIPIGTQVTISGNSLLAINGPQTVVNSGPGFIQWFTGTGPGSGQNGTVTVPPTPNTDVNFSLKKMIVSIRQDAWTPIRGSVM